MLDLQNHLTQAYVIQTQAHIIDNQIGYTTNLNVLTQLDKREIIKMPIKKQISMVN